MLLDCEHCNSTRSSSRILEHQGTSSIFSAFFILYEYDPRNTRNTLNFSEETENYRTSGNSIRRFLRANKGNISFTFRRPSMYNITDSNKVDPFQLAGNVYARKKYNIMLKRGIPRGAVEQTRLRDGPIAWSSVGHDDQCMKTNE